MHDLGGEPDISSFQVCLRLIAFSICNKGDSVFLFFYRSNSVNVRGSFMVQLYFITIYIAVVW